MSFGDIDDITNAVQERLQSHQPQPSLLHGDLWPANCAASSNGPVIFDPACYWGDRECDLSMLPLYPTLPAQFMMVIKASGHYLSVLLSANLFISSITY